MLLRRGASSQTAVLTYCILLHLWEPPGSGSGQIIVLDIGVYFESYFVLQFTINSPLVCVSLQRNTYLHLAVPSKPIKFEVKSCKIESWLYDANSIWTISSQCFSPILLRLPKPKDSWRVFSVLAWSLAFCNSCKNTQMHNLCTSNCKDVDCLTFIYIHHMQI